MAELKKWKNRLMVLGQEEIRREEAEREESERVEAAIRLFIHRVATPALLEIGNSADLIRRRSRLEAPGQSKTTLQLLRGDSVDTTLAIESLDEQTARLNVYCGPNTRRAPPNPLTSSKTARP